MQDSGKNKHYGIIFNNGNYRLVVNNSKHIASQENYLAIGYYDSDFNYIKLEPTAIKTIDGNDSVYAPHVCKITLANGLELESCRIDIKSKSEIKEYYKSFT